MICAGERIGKVICDLCHDKIYNLIGKTELKEDQYKVKKTLALMYTLKYFVEVYLLTEN